MTAYSNLNKEFISGWAATMYNVANKAPLLKTFFTSLDEKINEQDKLKNRSSALRPAFSHAAQVSCTMPNV